MITKTDDSTHDSTEGTTSSKTGTQDKDPLLFSNLVEHQQYNFMTGKEIRDRSRRVVLDAYVKAKTTTDQHYRPYTRRVVKAAKIWKGTKQKEKDNTEFTFRPKAANTPGGATNSNLFVFGKNMTQSVAAQVLKTP